MSRRGKARLSAILLGLVAIPASALAIVIDDRLTTGDTPSNVCDVPAEKTSFSASDAHVYLWVAIADVAVGDVVEWRWFAPDNSLYTTAQYITTFSGDGCAWAGINIQGQRAASLPGPWRVEVRLKGTLATQATFSIAAGPVSPPPSGPGAAKLEFSVNDQLLVPWGYVDLRYRIRSFRPGFRVDLYLALQLKGEQQCTSPDLVFAAGLPAVATDVALSDAEAAINAGFLPSNVGAVAMTLYGVLVAHGTSPADRANWVSNQAALDLRMGPLSSSQTELLAKRGNPQSYAIQFFPDTRQRIETWSYDGGGLGQIFQFINGRPALTDGGQGRARASRPSSPTFYGPGSFRPGMTPAAIRALLGDPDRIQSLSPGTETWLFTDSHITVTIKDGVVRGIVAY